MYQQVFVAYQVFVMNHLKEAIKIIQKKSISQLDIIDEDLISDKESLFTKLYTLIKNEDKLSDDEVTLLLYEKLNATTKQNFRKLKSRLSRKIYNTLFFYDMNNNNYVNSYQKIVFEQRKLVQVIKILEKNGARESTYKIIKDNYHTAELYYLYDVLKIYAFELSVYYSLTGNKSDFLFYAEKFKEFNQKESSNMEAILSYYHVQLLMQNMQKDTASKMQNLADLINKLGFLRDEAYSFETDYFYLRSQLYLFEYTNETDNMLKTSAKMLELCSQKHFTNTVWQGVASLYRAKALLSLKKLEEGESHIHEDVKLFEEGGINWFLAKEFELKFALHKKDVEKAEGILLSTTKNRSFAGKQANIKERWYIFKAYLQLLKEETEEFKGPSKIKTGKLLNETTFYVNDKSGFYLSIKILEIVEDLRKGRTTNFEDKSLALKKYKSRYLNSAIVQREKIFFNMILSLEKHGFNARKARLANKKNEEILSSNSPQFIINDFEILPYEFLWNIILKGLR